MCRWFAYLAPDEECLLEDVLITPKHALTKQVHDHYLPKLLSHIPGEETTKQEITLRNRLQNVDGFGVAWYTTSRDEFNHINGPRPTLYKHAQPPNHDLSFVSICANTSTTALFAHIRAATAGAVNSANNHPFAFGRHIIMHNGGISTFLDIKRGMLDLLDNATFENIFGMTDSEHLAALYITHLTKNKGGGSATWEEKYTLQEMKAALTAACIDIITLQQKTLGIDNAQANSLNVCVTDGAQMVAFRFRNHKIEQPPSLYWSDTAGVTLNRKYPGHPNGGENKKAKLDESEHGKHIIVASEPTTYNDDEWNLIEKNHALLVDDSGDYKHEQIDLPIGLLARGKSGDLL